LGLVFVTNHFIYSIAEEVVKITTSSAIQQTDSFSIRYLKAKNYFSSRNYTAALRTSLELLQSENSLTPKQLILINQLIADIYFESRNSKDAIIYYKKALNYFNAFKREQLDLNSSTNVVLSPEMNLKRAKVLLGIGTSFYRLEDTNISKKLLDSALYYYQKISNIKDLTGEVLEVKSRAYSNMSAVYMNKNLSNKAKEFALKAIEIHRSQHNKENEAAALGNLSSIFLREKKYDKAKNLYFEALDLIRNIETLKALKIREDLYFNLAFNLYKLKDYKSYDFQLLSHRIKDSLREKEFRRMITEISMEFDFNSKKKTLMRKEEYKRLRVAAVSLLVIFSLLYGVYYYKLRQKNLGLQLTQTKLIQHQNIEKIKSESQVRILNATIDGKESERKQIAETLHDSVSALLSSANLHLQATQSKFNGKTPEEIDKTKNIIMEASQVIRNLSHTLVSSVLLKFGLEYAIKDMACKYSNSQIEIQMNLGTIRRYHQNFEIKTYNIIQEFLNNILKHSKAEKAIINLEEVNGELVLKISDDGIGFDKVKIKNKEGLGLNQIEARIQMMKGAFDVCSSVNNGTFIRVRLPILEKEPIKYV
jgi:signal transduction histidine kinase